MAPLCAQPGRSHVCTRVVVAVVAALVAVLPAAHAYAEPSAAEVQKQIDAAWQKLEPLIEQYNKTRTELAANRAKAAALNRRIAPLGQQVDRTRVHVQEMAVNYYKQGGFAFRLNALLSTGSPTELTDQLALLNRIAELDQRQVAALSTQQATYDAEKKTLDALITKQEREQADLAARKKTIDAEITRLTALHKRIVAQEAAEAAAARAATAASTSSITSSSSLFIGGKCPAVPISGDGGVAAKTACQQIGKPYVWGANGPDEFDCSGLTQYAWKAAGVSLTHYTGAQWNEGTPVSRDNLRTGDLVFFYSDLHHVGIYVGNGLIVHASQAGVPIKMARLEYMPYAGARRPG